MSILDFFMWRPTMRDLILSGSAVLLGVVLAGAYWYLARTLVKRRIAASRWPGEIVVLKAVGRAPVLWLVVVGVFAGTRALPFRPVIHQGLTTALVVLIILSATWVVALVSGRLVRVWANRPEGQLPGASIFSNLTTVVVAILGFLVLLQRLGVSVTPLLTALGVGGIAVALALQDTLSNLFAGFQVLMSRLIRPGDYLKLESGEEGYVVDITWRYTTMCALPGNMIVVPNSKIAGSIVTNYSLPEQDMSLLVQTGVSYDSDLEHVEEVCIDVARQVMEEASGAVTDAEPLVRFHTFSDSSVDLTVILRVGEFVDQFAVKHAFVKRLHARFREEGIEIPFPIRTVHLQAPSEAQVPGGTRRDQRLTHGPREGAEK
ncbi:MAG: mechanosensitive ion channel family protein [Thermoleophilia bacterium]